MERMPDLLLRDGERIHVGRGLYVSVCTSGVDGYRIERWKQEPRTARVRIVDILPRLDVQSGNGEEMPNPLPTTI